MLRTANFRLSGQKLFCDFKNPVKILAEAEPRLWRGEAEIAQNPNSENWRRGRDSNSRNPLRLNSFQDCPIKPLWYPSAFLPDNYKYFKNLLFRSTNIFLGFRGLSLSSNPIIIISSPCLMRCAAAPFIQIIPEPRWPTIT